MQTSIDQAEKIKCEKGVAKTALADEDNKIDVLGTNGRKNIEISQRDLADIIEPRMIEIFTLVKDEITKCEQNNNLTFGIVLTGGGSKLENIRELAEDFFNLPIKKGIPDSINGIIDIINNPRYATVIGITQYASSDERNILESTIIDYNENFIDYMKTKINNFLKIIKIK